MKKNKRGFTIVELVIVIAVIGILAAVLIPTFSGVVKNANETALKEEARNSVVSYMALNEGVFDKDIATADTEKGWTADDAAHWTYTALEASATVGTWAYHNDKYQISVDEHGNLIGEVTDYEATSTNS